MSYYILPIAYIKNFFFSFGLFLEILMTFLSSCIPYIYHIFFFFPQVIVHTIYSVQAPFASSSNQNPLLLKFAPQSSSWHLHALIFGLRSTVSCVLFCLLSGSLPHFLVYTLNFLGVQKPTLHVKHDSFSCPRTWLEALLVSFHITISGIPHTFFFCYFSM